MESVGIFYVPLVCLRPFGKFYTVWVRVVYLFPFWYVVQRQILQHWRMHRRKQALNLGHLKHVVVHSSLWVCHSFHPNGRVE
jgi:hypothetical protein